MTRPALPDTIPSAARAIWSTARMFIAFHRDPARRKRAAPYLWPPTDAKAGLRHDPRDQETFIHLEGPDSADNVQIKIREERIIARREPGRGWSGIEIDDSRVRVLIDELWVEIDADGTITRRAADNTTYLEGDGAIIRVSEDSEILVSPDGTEITRRTPERIEGLTADGVVSRGRKG